MFRLGLRSGSVSGVDLERDIGGFEIRVGFLTSWITSIRSEVLSLKSSAGIFLNLEDLHLLGLLVKVYLQPGFHVTEEE